MSFSASAIKVEAEYKCKGDVAFHFKIKMGDNHVGSNKNYSLSICKSSWYNDWCRKPETKFISTPCKADNSKENENNFTSCIFDRPVMCDERLTNAGSEWYYSTYVVRILSFSSGKLSVLKEIPVSPFQYEFKCPDFSLMDSTRNQPCH